MKARLLALMIVTASMLVGAASASAELGGTVADSCGTATSTPLAVDPIKDFGISPTNHTHSEAGARGVFTPTMTVPQIMAAATTCAVPEDHTTMWVPNIITANGTAVQPTSIAYFLANGQTGSTPGQPLIQLPQGFRNVVGNHDCTSTSCHAGIWSCNGQAPTAVSSTIPKACPAGVGISVAIYDVSQCWDRKSVGQGMGSAGAAPSVTGLVNGACPPGRSAIPSQYWAASFPAAAVGGYLSSDNGGVNPSACLAKGCAGLSAHIDFVNGWTTSALAAIEKACLEVPSAKQDQPTCQVAPWNHQVFTLGFVDGHPGNYWGHQVTFPTMTS